MTKIKRLISSFPAILMVASLLYCSNLLGQCPNADFNLQSSLCIDETLILQNNSSNADKYQWDFCLEDFTEGALELPFKVTELRIGKGYKLIQDTTSGKWYGFITSYIDSKIFRLDFGINPMSTPNIFNLGNPNGLLNYPEGIDIINYNGNWYGFVGTDIDGNIVRLDFGSSLENVPTTVSIGQPGGAGKYRDLAIGFDGTDLVLFLLHFNSSSLVRVNFRDSFTNTIGPSDIKKEALTDLYLPSGLSLTQLCDRAVLHVVSSGYPVDNLQQLTLSSGLFGPFTLDWTTSLGGALKDPYRVKVKPEGSNYIAVISNESVTPAIVNLFDISSTATPQHIVRPDLPVVLGFDFIKYGSKNIIQGISSFDDLKTLIIERPCNASMPTSNIAVPNDVHYTNAGTWLVELSAGKSNYKSTQAKTVVVENKIAPNISINHDNICVESSVTFNAQPEADVVSWVWDFGDGETSGYANPSHVYSAIGNYNVTLNITSNNGCNNRVTESIDIFKSPIAAFDLPPNDPLCTNQQLLFANRSTFDTLSNPAWQWFVNGLSVSIDDSLRYTFSTIIDHTILLRASIPGCYTEVSKTINSISIKSGPNVNFSFSPGSCRNDEIVFTNTTTDPVTGYLWTFGDTQTSTVTDIQVPHTYTILGDVVVSLQGNSSNGCQNVASKNLTIYTKPATDFSLALPPFSCNGSESQFNDITPNPIDSNLDSWSWSFGDATSGLNTSTSKNPKHTFATAGNYNVTLKVTTDFNCSTTFQKPVTISQSPNAGFTNTPVCKNLAVKFTPIDGINPLNTYLWEIGNTFYTRADPTHTFPLLGVSPVTLTVTGSNSCLSTITKEVKVHIPLVPTFSVEKNCNKQNTLFTSTTIITDDSISAYNWKFPEDKTGSPITFSFENAGDFDVTLKVTGASGCIYSGTKKVSVVGTPVASFTATPESGVPPLNVKFTNSSTNVSSSGSTFLWTFNDELNSTSTEISPSHTFQLLGEFVVDLKATNSIGCSNTISKVIIVAIPFNDISISIFNVTENADGTLTGIATLKNNGNVVVKNVNLSLDLSGDALIRENVAGPIPPRTSYSHVIGYQIFKTKGLNYLCAEVQMEKDSIPENNRKCTSLHEQLYFYDVYPNPAKDHINIEWLSKDNNTDISVKLFDSLGKQVLSDELHSIAEFNQVTLPVVQLNSGLYILSIKAGSTQKLQRIAIAHN